ncbi:MAG: acetylglutamate kinase [Actinomycetia bacterium]|nr:acetylglutamate kinase [Actinomycetes bacterium]
MKAATLAEALPWLEEFSGATVVVKYGGNAMVDEDLQESFASDIVFLRRVGLRPVVVHGGGPQISQMLDRLGVESEFVGGLRVTTPEAMDVVRMVLTGQVQRQVVSHINQHGALAVGLSGEDARLFIARRRTALHDGSQVELGQVGDLVSVDADFVRTVLGDGLVPVISSVARGLDGATYNINADTAAAALAVELSARKLVMLTDVPGVYANWPDTTEIISQITAEQLRALVPTLSGGMIPKLTACLAAVDGGVRQAHVLDGRLPHALLLEVFTDAGVGTLVVPDDVVEPAAKHEEVI